MSKREKLVAGAFSGTCMLRRKGQKLLTLTPAMLIWPDASFVPSSLMVKQLIRLVCPSMNASFSVAKFFKTTNDPKG